ncbi:glycosyltransferase [Fluviicola chungangensis]|uniref:Glycosyltransferase family 4 protein n=1 Tax=Fluviicola chungangensis TaxID=2597671 RepID=A0A556N068_9FLAO|nr:glycosyltransferase [Fluviicola chungangensis]TSJ45580.1 glycosyltransferase family 4 protein [Fluviicola chungangensis]
MPKVLRIINRFNIGGPTYNATFLTKFISEDYETLLVGGLPEKDESDSLHIPENYGVNPLLIPEMKRIPNFRSDREAYRKIKQIIREFQPDIVHTHAAKAGALGRKAAKACGVPVIVHTFHGHVFHSYFGRTKTWIYKVIERRLAKISTGIVAISPMQKEELSAVHGICSPDKIKVIPLGFDLSKFQENLPEKRMETRQKWNLGDEEIAVAIVGRLAPIKNHVLFLDVIQLLAAKGIKARYFIVGDGQEKASIEQRAKELEDTYGVKVELTSWIIDIATFNAGMDIICLSSDNEGTPVSLIEAQASGIPVISTDVGGVKDILAEGETGFVVPKNDAKSFGEKLQLLIENKEIRSKMSQNGWNFVRDKFHYTTLVKNMEDYYAELIEKTRKNAK